LSPLGQAEWIKVVGLLTGNVEKANQIFGTIEAKYNELKAMVDTVSVRPTIFSGEMRSGNWYAVGGKSFLAQLFRDAGGDYFLKDNEESGGVTLDYETVYANAAHSDYWRIVNSYDGEFSYDVLGQQDKRYTDFDAWKKHGVIYCNMNTTAFYESMPVEPEVILADFIHVLHPNILPDHKPRYYHLLEK
jgi:iron complex transport system substrate-binding protein